jgi:hypothetical protein
MALNLSTLTSPATSGDVLAEALTTADFLEPCPVLKNLARGSNKGGDAEQAVALNQPKALPLIDGKGYLYLSGVTGNYASVTHGASLAISGALDFRVKLRGVDITATQMLLDNANVGSVGFNLQLFSSRLRAGTTVWGVNSSYITITTGDLWVRVTSSGSGGTLQFYESEDGINWLSLGSGVDGGRTAASTDLFIGTTKSLGSPVGGAIPKVEIYASTDGTDKRLDIDFTATNVRHGDTKFKCATGQTVTINQSGNDPATIR